MSLPQDAGMRIRRRRPWCARTTAILSDAHPLPKRSACYRYPDGAASAVLYTVLAMRPSQASIDASPRNELQRS
jgi:hypothetical protein